MQDPRLMLMKTAEIRRRWFNYFSDRDHTIVPSAPLVSDDPSLLFNIAGMVPFIPYLSGLVPSPWERATSIQKCIRTTDIEEVGKTPRHGTFFQMAGNFSFGDYFKRGAISYAWDFLTSDEEKGGLGFRAEDLWVTVFKDDDEAIALWQEISGLPDERIQRLDEETNYWSTGQPGPAGPSSEIFFDRGRAYGRDGGPATDDDRYVEIWNLVFLQYQIDNVRSKTAFDVVRELPHKNIDTGMGLERVAFLKQGVENMYEIDEVRPVLDRAAEISGRSYGASQTDDIRLRVVADHVRSALMLMSDGVRPSNEGRGYILRRLLRRTIRSMRLLGVEVATFPELFPVSREAMRLAYPEVSTGFDRIARLAYAEEETFLRTLASGTAILESAVAQTKSLEARRLSGDTAFLLHDTFGFPIDLTLEIAEESGLTVDRRAFDALMLEQRTRAKSDAKSKKTALADLSVYGAFRARGETIFTGYEELNTESAVLGLIVGGKAVKNASAGDTAEIILTRTSLYAESGGQEADAGTILGAGFELEVLDVLKPIGGLISHRVLVRSGEVAVGDAARSIVDPIYRRGAAQAHSATHLVHAALREVLGAEASQAGSYNRAGYMRLDFNWSRPLSSDTRLEIEEIANAKIRDDLQVTTQIVSLDDARAMGAMALFGERYGERVRMVEIGGPWSRELCAGIHVSSSSQIGLINLTSESSVGATSRRVEAIVGLDAFREFAAERAIISELTSSLKTPREQLPQRIASLAQSLKAAERRIAEFEENALESRVPNLARLSSRVGDLNVVVEQVHDITQIDELRFLATRVRDRFTPTSAAVVALFAEIAGKPVVVVATTEAARERGFRAGVVAREAAFTLGGGGGGGKDDLAQGGGTDAKLIPAAIEVLLISLRS